MEDYPYKLNNQGILIDLSTGTEYPFFRPSTTAGLKPHKWNVKVHDVVSFTLTNGVVSDVALYRKANKDDVYSYVGS